MIPDLNYKKKLAPHAVSCLLSNADSPVFTQHAAQAQLTRAISCSCCQQRIIVHCALLLNVNHDAATVPELKLKIKVGTKKKDNKNSRDLYRWFAGQAERLASAPDTALQCTAGCIALTCGSYPALQKTLAFKTISMGRLCTSFL